MDEFQALLGGVPSDAQKMATLAKLLRARQQIGQTGVIMGGPFAEPGKAQMASAEDMGQRLGSLAEQQRYRQYQEGATAEGHALQRAMQTWREKDAEADRAHAINMENLRFEHDKTIEGMREAAASTKASTPKTKAYTVKDIKDLSGSVQDAVNLKDVAAGFDDKYSGGTLPGQRALKNTMVQYGLGSAADDKASDWWARYNNLYTLPTRNKLFGSALTATEKEEWDKNAITPSMKPEVIRQRLGNLERIRDGAIRRMRENLLNSQYDPKTTDSIFKGYDEEPVIPLD